MLKKTKEYTKENASILEPDGSKRYLLIHKYAHNYKNYLDFVIKLTESQIKNCLNKTHRYCRLNEVQDYLAREAKNIESSSSNG